jgi:hypothetical protein
MKLKHAILETLSRDELKRICADLEVTDVDQRSIEDMAAKLSRARRATPEKLFEYLSEARDAVLGSERPTDSGDVRGRILKEFMLECGQFATECAAAQEPVLPV